MFFKKKPPIPEPDFAPHPSIQRARQIANLMDSAITLPVIRKKVGLDPVLGLLPAGGDMIAALIALYPVYVAYEIGLPDHIIRRMAVNVGVDLLIGLVPVVGDISDMFFKSNQKNLGILEQAYKQHLMDQYAKGGEPPVINVQAQPVPKSGAVRS